MSLRNRVLYQSLAVHVSPSPSTGYLFSSGNSGINNIQTLERVQSVTDSFTVNRINVTELGQLAILGKLIVSPPTVPMEMTWLVADLSNERKVGLYVSGDLGVMTNLLNKTQDDKNYFIEVAPEGVDAVGYTGQSQVKYVTNGYIGSWSTEGAVGGLPSTTMSIVGFNWAAATGSINQQLNAIDIFNNLLTTGVNFTIPVATSGIANTIMAVRPSEITATIGSGIGLNMQDVKLQRYNLSFNLNRQDLNKLGSFFPYSKEVQFPVDVTCSITAYWGDLTTGSLANLVCNDQEYTVQINLRQPTCIGQPAGIVAAQYTLLGAKLDSQSFSDSISDVASTVTLNFTSSLGSATDTVHNLYLSGINI